jgi:probable F420-dependent oxidoreductase
MVDLGRIGVWSGTLRNGERAAIVNACKELEDLGYGAVWFPGGPPEGVTELMQAMLDATQKVVVAPGIINIWTHPPDKVARDHHVLQDAHPGRFLLGIGVSHQHVVQNAGLDYRRPLAKMVEYLDALDRAERPVPVDERIIAALGPKMLDLARDRSAGTHPYFVPVEHTRVARQAMGPGKLVATELMVVLETDPTRAREVARAGMQRYLNAPNYTNNLKRHGYSDADIANGGSDGLVDAIVAWGDEQKILDRVREHHQAGADHICIQVLGGAPSDIPMDGWRRLARAWK